MYETVHSETEKTKIHDMPGQYMPVNALEDTFTWLLPSGERRPGKISVGIPEMRIGAATKPNGFIWRSTYSIEPLRETRLAPPAPSSLEAFTNALRFLCYEIYWAFGRGARVLRHDGMNEDPLADTANLVLAMGPLIRECGNPRGVADPDGKIKEIEDRLEMWTRVFEGEIPVPPGWRKGHQT